MACCARPRARPGPPRSMIAFFDTSVHIALLRGTLSPAAVLREVGRAPIRLSPVVASELLRGTSGRARRAVARLVRRLLPLEPSSWRRCWIEAGWLVPRIFPDHEEVGLVRLQNDTLIPLTARHTGAILLSRDLHFAALRRHVPFALTTLG